MSIRVELNLRLPNSPGALAGVCGLLANERINILALTVESAGHLRLVVDNHVHAAAVLRERHHQVRERDVLFVALPNTVGALAPVLRLVSEAGINVEYAYGGAGDAAGQPAVVLGVDHAQRAATVAGI